MAASAGAGPCGEGGPPARRRAPVSHRGGGQRMGRPSQSYHTFTCKALRPPGQTARRVRCDCAEVTAQTPSRQRVSGIISSWLASLPVGRTLQTVRIPWKRFPAEHLPSSALLCLLRPQLLVPETCDSLRGPRSKRGAAGRAACGAAGPGQHRCPRQSLAPPSTRPPRLHCLWFFP